MNEQEIVNHMIEFVEKTYLKIASNKLASTNQTKGDAVKAILDELERVTTNENK